MITWMHPYFFVLLAALPVLGWWRWRRRGRMRFASLQLLEPAPTVRRALAWLPELLLFAGMGLAVVALARPQLTEKETWADSEGIDIMLALDVSGSMEAPDFTIGGRRASRLDVAKAVLARFVEGRPHDRTGLVVFGEEAFTQVPLTLDHESMVAFLREVEIGMAGERQTAIGDAIAICSQRLKEVDAPSRVAILLTDGRNNAGAIGPEEAAEAAGALDIRIYTIGVGSRDGGGGLFGMRTRGELDEETLRAIAEATGGRYFRADDTQTLQRVYDTIDGLEKTTARVREVVLREERYQPVLLAAIISLLLHALLVNTVFRRIP